MKSKVIKSRSVLLTLERIACALILLWAVCLLVAVFLHAGPLWRDEINSRWMAMRPSISVLWNWMDKDSFPLLWFAVLRGWIATGLGETDQGLRALGLIIGMGMLAAMFWAARVQGKRLPLLFFAIFALHPIMFRFGTSIRSYGLGITTMLVMVGCLLLYIERPNTRRLIAATIFSFIAVHTVYYNSIVLCAVCLAGAGVCFAARRFRQVLWLGGIGIVCALSILPYVLGPMTRAKEWAGAVASNVTLKVLVTRFEAWIDMACSGESKALLALMAVVYLGCLAGCVRWKSARRRRRALFIVLAVPLLLVLYFGFLLLLNYNTQPWYYITLLAFLALAVDRGAEVILRHDPRGRALRLALAVAMALWTAQGAWNQSPTRATNVDLVAAAISQEAVKGDYVIVTPWYVGVSFARYYQGQAPWDTVPPIDDFNLHRYDLFQRQMADPHGITPMLTKIQAALTSGHRVWYVGEPSLPGSGQEPGPIPSASDVRSRGSEGKPDAQKCLPFWEAHVGYELVRHGREKRLVTLPIDGPVNPFESPRLFVIEGAERK